MSEKTYDDGVIEGRLNSHEERLDAHKERMEGQDRRMTGHSKRLSILEKVSWMLLGGLLLIEFLPAISRALAQ